MTAMTPMGHLGKPEDIAAGVSYLASDDAKFVTGLEVTSTAATSPAEPGRETRLRHGRSARQTRVRLRSQRRCGD